MARRCVAFSKKSDRYAANLQILKTPDSVIALENDVPFKVGIYKLEVEDSRSLEFVTEDEASIVWEDLFEDDYVAFKEAVAKICSEGAGNL